MNYLNGHSRRNFTLLLCSLVSILAILACQIEVGGPEPPGAVIPTTQGGQDLLSSAWDQAVEAALTTGRVMVIFDEIQLTTFLSSELAEQEEPPLLSPQVYLQEDSIQIYGILDQGPFLANALLVVQPEIEPDGQLSFELTQADVGPLPLPSALKNTISAILTEAFTGTIGSLATGVRITSIAISDGEMAIVGELR
ncbi:MAG: hypothetical protein PVF49_03500 [Anaerolineales bacterium]